MYIDKSIIKIILLFHSIVLDDLEEVGHASSIFFIVYIWSRSSHETWHAPGVLFVILHLLFVSSISVFDLCVRHFFLLVALLDKNGNVLFQKIQCDRIQNVELVFIGMTYFFKSLESIGSFEDLVDEWHMWPVLIHALRFRFALEGIGGGAVALLEFVFWFFVLYVLYTQTRHGGFCDCFGCLFDCLSRKAFSCLFENFLVNRL